MPTRTRSRVVRPFYHDGGSASHIPNILAPSTPVDRPFLIENMTDFTGNFTSTNPLDLTQVDAVLGWYSGANGGGNAWNCKSYRALDSDRLAIPAQVSNSVAATQALARANPNRPVVDVWNFLFELKDIPAMIKQIGLYMRKYGANPSKNWPKKLGGFPRDIGDAYLGWTFGWDLLIRDLGKLFDQMASIDQRINELNSLRSGDLRKTVTIIDEHSPLKVVSYLGPTYSATTQYQFNLDVYDKIWVRVKYKPSAFTLRALDGDMLHLARSLAYGHTPSISTVWNAIPWTWMIDWFGTVGDYLAAQRNTLQIKVDDIAVMKRRIVTYQSVLNPGVMVTGPFGEFKANPHYGQTYKYRRKVSGPSVSFYIPFLSGKQLSILGALGLKYMK